MAPRRDGSRWPDEQCVLHRILRVVVDAFLAARRPGRHGQPFQPPLGGGRSGIEAAGARVIYLPPYSPDLNPIENIFSKVKQLFRGLRPRSFRQIVADAKQVLSKITLDDIDLVLVFLHCGYAGA
jgi:transposase